MTLALWLTLALPFLLLHATSLGEIAIGGIDAAFVVHLAQSGRWVRSSWLAFAAAWWGWLVVCSLPGVGTGGWPSLVQALLAGRYLLLVAALECWVLVSPDARRWVGRAMLTAWLYYAAHLVAQFLTGRNLFGIHANADGVLTDPIGRARIAAPLSRILPPVLLPPVGRLLARRNAAGWAGALGLVVAALAVLLSVGQRMPLALTLLGLAVAAIWLPRLRPVAFVAGLIAAGLIAASPVVAPVVFGRLVTQFREQLGHFRTSDYGLIYDRAAAMLAAHPWHGRGFDGFKTGCMDPAYFTDLARAAVNPAIGCNIHPHNHYLQAATDAGLPGLVLFSALVLAWLRALARGLWREPSPLRVGLFAAVLIDQWPIASTSSMFAIEIEGFFFIILGWGLAEAATVNLPRTASKIGMTEVRR